MENQIKFIVDIAQKTAAYHKNTKKEVEDILKTHGATNFTVIGNVMFSTNEHGILEGLGFDSLGNFKVWKNCMFGTFDEKAEKEEVKNKKQTESE